VLSPSQATLASSNGLAPNLPRVVTLICTFHCANHPARALRTGRAPITGVQAAADSASLAGDPTRQETVLRSAFEKVELSVETAEVARVEPRPWVQALFGDMSAWYVERAWRDSNPRPTA
jgi:hypothetical protein